MMTRQSVEMSKTRVRHKILYDFAGNIDRKIPPKVSPQRFCPCLLTRKYSATLLREFKGNYP